MSGLFPSSSLNILLQAHQPLLRDLADRYGVSPDDAANDPARVVIRVMNSGTAIDTGRLLNGIGEEHLRHVLQQARAGEFTELGWRHWHVKLGMALDGKVPPMPA